MGRRKPTVTTRVIELPSSDEENANVMSDDDEEMLSKSRKPGKNKENGRAVPEDLPEGTVVVEPSSASDDDSGSGSGDKRKAKKKNSKSNGAPKGEMPTELIRCTACANHLLQQKRKHLCLHPVLEVLICRKCYDFYTSGDFDKDEEGYDEQCRWCGEGGLLLGCDYCTNAFCKPCIKRNVGRSALYNLVNAPEGNKWHCYVCQPAPLKKLQKQCQRILEEANRKHEQRKREKNGEIDAQYHLADIKDNAVKFQKLQTAILDDLKSLENKIDDCEKQAAELSSKKFNAKKEKLAAKLESLLKLMKNGANMLKLAKKVEQDPLDKRVGAAETKGDLKVRSSLDLNPDLKEDSAVIESEDDVPQAMEVTVDIHKAPGKEANDDSGVLPIDEDKDFVNITRTADDVNDTTEKKSADNMSDHDEIIELSDHKFSNDTDSNCDSKKSVDPEENETGKEKETHENSDAGDEKKNLKKSGNDSSSSVVSMETTNEITKDDNNSDDEKSDDTVGSVPITGSKKASNQPQKADKIRKKSKIRKRPNEVKKNQELSDDDFEEEEPKILSKSSAGNDKEAEDETWKTPSRKSVNKDSRTICQSMSNSKKDSAASDEIGRESSDSDQSSEIISAKENTASKENDEATDIKLKPLIVRLARCDSGSENSSVRSVSVDSTSKRSATTSKVEKGTSSDEEAIDMLKDSRKSKSGPKCARNKNRVLSSRKLDEKRNAKPSEHVEKTRTVDKVSASENEDEQSEKDDDDEDIGDEGEPELDENVENTLQDTKRNKRSRAGPKCSKMKNRGDETTRRLVNSTVVEESSQKGTSAEIDISEEDNEKARGQLKEMMDEMGDDDDDDDDVVMDEPNCEDAKEAASESDSGSKVAKNDKAKEELEKMMMMECDNAEDDEVSAEETLDDTSALRALEDMMDEEGVDNEDNGEKEGEPDMKKDSKKPGKISDDDDDDDNDDDKDEDALDDSGSDSKKQKKKVSKKIKISTPVVKLHKMDRNQKKKVSPKKESPVKSTKKGAGEKKLFSSSSESDTSDDEDDKPQKKKLKKRAKKSPANVAAKAKKSRVLQSSDSSDFEKILSSSKSKASKPGPKCSKNQDSKNSQKDNVSKKSGDKEGKKYSEKDGRKAAKDSDSELDRDIKRLTATISLSTKKKKKGGSDESEHNDSVEVKNESTVAGKVNGSAKQGESDSDAMIQEISDNSESEEESNTAKLLRELGMKSGEKQVGKKAAANSGSDDSDVEDLGSDSDAAKQSKKSKPKAKKESESESSATSRSKKKKKQYGADLLRGKLSESDSDSETKKGKRKSKRVDPDDSDLSEVVISDSDVSGKKRSKRKRGQKDSDSDSAPGKKRRRRRIKTLSDSSIASDEEDRPKMKRKKKGEQTDSENEIGDDAPGSAHKRKHIRKIISDKKLEADTKAATQEEQERRDRVEERQKLYNEIHCQSETIGEDKVPVTTKLVLEFDEESKEAIIEVDKDLIRNLKPHQVEAVRFMWNCTIESLEMVKKNEGSGCILAHCMGLGKTLSVITLAHTVLRHEKLLKLRTCLIICPLNTVLNWENEWAKWFEDTPDVKANVFEMSQYKTNHHRLACLKDWQHEGGVCIIGYEMFRNLAKGNHMRAKKMKASFAECLLDPGPDMVVCDEGHILKNCDSGLSKITSDIKSKRRIILTGTPLQNNLSEYHCMVSFVKPKLLGTKKEFYNRFIAPITNGSCADSTSRDVRIMKKRAHVLHEMLNGCVQRRDYSALTPYLPPKFEYVISVRLSSQQIELYQKYLDRKEEESNTVGTTGTRLFQDFQALMRIWTHPWVIRMHHVRVLEQRAKQELEESDEDFLDDNDLSESESSKSSTSSSSDNEEAKSLSGSERPGPARRGSIRRRGRRASGSDDEIVSKWSSTTRSGVEGAENGDQKEEENDEVSEWWSDLVKDDDEKNLRLSGKLIILFEILKKAEEIGDKVLVFSQSLLSLNIIEKFLEIVDMAPGTLNAVNGENGETEDMLKKPLGCTWVKGADYFRLDGSTNAFNRQKYCDVFNDYENPRARLFLISTRAGSLGINLVHANRVVVFDASWNPTYDVQSMFRVYRFGQLKPVYVYRLVAQGTMEEKIYERQVTKQSLSQRVVDEHQIDRHFNAQDLQELYRFEPDRLDDPNRKERPTPTLPKDLFLADLLKEQVDWIVGYHEHDSLLENRVDQELTEEERKAAWEEYEAEKKGLITNVGPYVGAAGGVSASEWLSHYAQRGSMLPNYANPMMAQMLMPPDSFLQEVSRQLLRQNPDMPPAEVMQRARGYWIRNLQVQELQKQQLLAAQQQELIRLHQIRQQQRLLEHQRLQQAQQEASRSKPSILQSRSSDSATMRSLLSEANNSKPETHVIADD